jgi:hypothetical protein
MGMGRIDAGGSDWGMGAMADIDLYENKILNYDSHQNNLKK